jgi:hypothetical protein
MESSPERTETPDFFDRGGDDAQGRLKENSLSPSPKHRITAVQDRTGAAGEQWLSFNVPEDNLIGLTIGETVSVIWNGADKAFKAVITELRPLGTFATWQAERVIGDHDRNTLRLRLDPKGKRAGLEPGMTVWINNQQRQQCSCRLF